MTNSNVTYNDDDDLPSLGTFDFLVVGAGPSAAGLLKGLLTNIADASAAPTFTAAVVEQGGDDDEDANSIHRDMRYWATASQGATPHVVATIGQGRRVFPVSLAVGLGGNTRVNAGLVVPPALDDLTALPFVTKNTNEGQEAVDAILKCLPIRRSAPPAAARQQPRRGGADDDNDQSTTVPETPHFWNVMTYPSVCCHVPCCVDECGRRVTYYEALVQPSHKKNTTITTRNPLDTFLHHKVERIETTTGNDRRGSVSSLIVRNVTTGRLYRLYARRDVILCAGTVETPALLVASGLLDNETVAPVVDHHVLPKIYLHKPRRRSGGDDHHHYHPTNTNGVSALTHYVTNRTRGKIQVGYHEGETLVDLVPYLVAAVTWFHITPPGTMWHQILLQFVQGLVTYTPLYYILTYCVTVQTIFLMNPHSHGTLSIVPSSKQQGRDEPQQRRRPPMYRSDYDVTMDLRYLSDERDMDKFAEAWQQYNSSSLLDMDDDCWLVFPWAFSRTFARLFVLPYFHWMGTTSRHVDRDFRFVIPTTTTTTNRPTTADTNNSNTDHAAAGAASSPLSVRVCDASILPGLSAPTALTCAALGYILGNRLRKELG